MPLVRVDVACLSVANGSLKVLLTQRANEPFKGCWGLPGGVLRIDMDASLEAAAQRVGQERMGLDLGQVDQVVAMGGADRDPRAPWAMTVVYRCMVNGGFAPELGKRIEALKWFTPEELASQSLEGSVAFDHGELIKRAVQGLRSDVASMRFAPSWFEGPFTVPDLQAFCEVVLGEPLDKVTFRRRLEANQVLCGLPGQLRTGAHRPAQLYEFQSIDLA